MLGKGRGKKGRGRRGNKHTRFKTYGAAHDARYGDVLRMLMHLEHNETSSIGGRPPQYAPPLTLTFDILTLKVVSESRPLCQF